MNETEQTLELKLLGQKIVLKTYESSPETVQKVVQLVSYQLAQAEVRAKGKAPHHIALLALFDLAEEYLDIKNRMKHLNDHQKRNRIKN